MQLTADMLFHLIGLIGDDAKARSADKALYLSTAAGKERRPLPEFYGDRLNQFWVELFALNWGKYALHCGRTIGQLTPIRANKALIWRNSDGVYRIALMVVGDDERDVMLEWLKPVRWAWIYRDDFGNYQGLFGGAD